jgi:hypothetical protein
MAMPLRKMDGLSGMPKRHNPSMRQPLDHWTVGICENTFPNELDH